jgi:hypothetical protein
VPIRQKLFFLSIAVMLLLVILELVRRRRMRIEYSWLWIASGLTTLVVILRYDVLIWLTELIGAVIPTSTLFFLSILYLALLSLNYSVRLTTLTQQVKELAQEVALFQAEREEAVSEGAPRRSGPSRPLPGDAP